MSELNKKDYPNLYDYMVLIGEKVKEEYQVELLNNTNGFGNMFNSVASGELYDSVNFRLEKKDGKLSLYFVADKHYINVEKGRVAGRFPPKSVILRWLDQRGIQPNQGVTKEGLAFIISRSIAEKGIKPKPHLREILTNMQKYVDGIKTALKKDLGLNIDKLKLVLKDNTSSNKNIKFK